MRPTSQRAQYIAELQLNGTATRFRLSMSIAHIHQLPEINTAANLKLQYRDDPHHAKACSIHSTSPAENLCMAPLKII